MRLGLVARGEDRGLGHITWEVCRHMAPAKVLLVDMGVAAKGFQTWVDRYPSDITTKVLWDEGLLDEGVVREWLKDLDVVYTAETFYDLRLGRWCQEAGVGLVVHVMPEFWKPELEEATARWFPTMWRFDLLAGDGDILMPVPVALDRFPEELPQPTDTLRVLHVVGNRAVADRNGTSSLLRALTLVKRPMKVRLITQGVNMAIPRRPGSCVDMEVVTGGMENYWDLYEDSDVLVMPRRYGGLCLPVQEAMGRGLAVVMTDVEPNRDWPIVPVTASLNGRLNTPGGSLRIAQAQPQALARTLDRLVEDPTMVGLLKMQSRGWAERHSWTAYKAGWVRALETAAR